MGLPTWARRVFHRTGAITERSALAHSDSAELDRLINNGLLQRDVETVDGHIVPIVTLRHAQQGLIPSDRTCQLQAALAWAGFEWLQSHMDDGRLLWIDHQDAVVILRRDQPVAHALRLDICTEAHLLELQYALVHAPCTCWPGYGPPQRIVVHSAVPQRRTAATCIRFRALSMHRWLAAEGP